MSLIINQDNVSLRKARRRDWREMKACNERNLKENYDERFWQDCLTACPNRSVVLSDGKQEVRGYILYYDEKVYSVAVDINYRNQGWGKKLLHFFLQLNQDIFCLTLHVRVNNEVAIRLYKKMGFVIEEKLNQYYQNPMEDGYCMTKRSGSEVQM